jgi:hypothetical protein
MTASEITRNDETHNPVKNHHHSNGAQNLIANLHQSDGTQNLVANLHQSDDIWGPA